MDKQDQIRTQLDNKVFTPYGKSAIIYSVTESTDAYGDLVNNTLTISSTATIVDYDIFSSRKAHLEFGDLKEGDREAIFRYDVSLSTDSVVSIGSDYFKVSQIEKPSLPDVIVQIVRLAKTNDSFTVST